MTPITWRNVNSKSNNDAAYLMRGAQEGITGGLDRVAGVVKGIEQNQQDNYNIVKDNNTNAFKDMMAGFSSEEELNAAVQSGAVQRMADSFGFQADQDVLRNGVKNREESLRSSLTADQQFGQQQQTYQDSQDKLSFRSELDALATAQAGTTPEDDQEYKRILSELNANPKWTNLGLGAELQKDWNNSLLSENALRLKAQKEDDAEVNRQSGLNFENGISTIMNKAETDPETGYPNIPLARAQLVDAMKNGELGPMNNADSQRIIKVLGERMAEQSGLTPGQLQTAEATQIQSQIQADKDIRLANTALQTTLAENKVNEEFSFNDADRSAVDIAITQGWDTDNVSKEMLATREKLMEAYGEGDANYKPMTGMEADKILAMAQAQMGDEKHFFGYDKNDLPTARLYKQAQLYWKEYQTNLTKIENRKNAQDTYTSEEARAKAMPGNAYNTTLGQFRKNNLAVQKLVDAQRQPSVTP